MYLYITLRLRQNGHLFADDTYKCIFLNENVWISNKISLKFVSEGLINYMAALFQIMAWWWRGNKPLSEAMMAYWTWARFSLGLQLAISISHLHAWCSLLSTESQTLMSDLSWSEGHVPLLSISMPHNQCSGLSGIGICNPITHLVIDSTFIYADQIMLFKMANKISTED